MSVQELQTPQTTGHQEHGHHSGLLPSQGLERAAAEKWIEGWIAPGRPYGIESRSFQPASLDLRLGEHAWELRSSFLPDPSSSVEDKLSGVAMDKISIAEGRTLDRNRPYLIPLIEELRLPRGVRGKANPKSSTGRLDVFTRVITDGNGRFDEIPDGYRGRLYLEVVPRSFPIRVERFLSLNQLRLIAGNPRVIDADLPQVHSESPLLYAGGVPVPERSLETSDGLFLGVDLRNHDNKPVGYRAKDDTPRLDMATTREHLWSDFWEAIYPERNGRIILSPERFYLLFSAESVCVPP